METMNNILKFNVEGTNWKHTVELDREVFDTDRSQYIEAASRAIEFEMKENELDIGALVIVKKEKTKKEIMVNSYICLNNISQFKLAEELRQNFLKKSNGQDLAVDEIGYSEADE